MAISSHNILFDSFFFPRKLKGYTRICSSTVVGKYNEDVLTFYNEDMV